MTRQNWFWITIIMVGAAVLLFWDITTVPPGITHDEADHSLSAWEVVQGIRPLYFTVGYGREPLYDYATSILMSFMGANYLASRLTSIYFALILVAATFACISKLFGRTTALLTCAGMATSFWFVMVGRHALRTITMPALFTLAITLWYSKRPIPAGILLGATFYTYFPARILWFLLPSALIWMLLFDRNAWRKRWRPTLITLAIAAIIAFPLLYHIETTGVEQRISQLNRPLTEIRENNNWEPLRTNALSALKLFTIAGDDGEIMWRYNIPARPLLNPIIGTLFYAGIALALYHTIRHRHTPSAIALIWLIGGLTPSIITGAEGSTTRAIGIIPVLYLFPTLLLRAFAPLRETLPVRANHSIVRAKYISPLLIILFTIQLGQTTHAYFTVWANDPAVRVQYESTRIAAINWLNDPDNGDGAAAISSPQPGRYHDATLGIVALNNPAVTPRWFNGAHSIVLPDDDAAELLFSGYAPSTILDNLNTDTLNINEIPLDGDLDRPITIHTVNTRALTKQLLREWTTITPAPHLSDFASLRAYHLTQNDNELHLMTLWHVDANSDSEITLFSNLFDPIAQQEVQPNSPDRLDVPSPFWQPNDHFIQLHTIPLPENPENSPYLLYIGGYFLRDDGIIEPIPMVDGDKQANEYLLLQWKP